MAVDYKKSAHAKSPFKQSLFSFVWHRIILDEGTTFHGEACRPKLMSPAHIIQNRHSALYKAACALESINRWAVTGTPIQNKLTDLQSLLGFLRLYPFSSHRVFDTEVIKPWLRSDPNCISKLRTLVNCIALCRDKAAIDLPSRTDKIYRLEFSHDERKVYDIAKVRTKNLLNSAIATDCVATGVYLNALSWLNDLRLICNHGTLHSICSPRFDTKTNGEVLRAWDTKLAQDAFISMMGAGSAICVGCSNNLASGFIEDDEVVIGSEDLHPLLSKCLSLVCGSCRIRSVEDPSFLNACKHSPRCPSLEVSLSNFSTASSGDNENIVQANLKNKSSPTKVRVLLQELQRCRAHEKRYA